MHKLSTTISSPIYFSQLGKAFPYCRKGFRAYTHYDVASWLWRLTIIYQLSTYHITTSSENNPIPTAPTRRDWVRQHQLSSRGWDRGNMNKTQTTQIFINLLPRRISPLFALTPFIFIIRHNEIIKRWVAW